MEAYGFCPHYSEMNRPYGYSRFESPISSQSHSNSSTNPAYYSWGYGYQNYESHQVHNKWYQSHAPLPPVEAMTRSQVWNRMVDSKVRDESLEENDAHKEAIMRKMLKYMEDIQAGLSNTMDMMDEFNQKWSKSSTTISENVEVIHDDFGKEVHSGEKFAKGVLKNGEHQVFDKMTELGFDTHTEEVVGTEEFVIEQAIVDEEFLKEDSVFTEEAQGTEMMVSDGASFKEMTLVNQDYRVFEKITEPETKLLIEGNEDKWYSTGCNLNLEYVSYLITENIVNGGCVFDYKEQKYDDNNNVIKFSRKPKMKRRWKEKYWIDLAILVEILTLANASDLNSVTHVEDDANIKHENCLENENDSSDGDLLPLHGNGSKISVLFRCPVGLFDDNVDNLASTIHTAYKHSSSFGTSFDIDGVILRGAALIGNSRRALRRLYDASGTLRISFLLLTNSGSIPESIRAVELSDFLGVKIWPSQVVQGHDMIGRASTRLGKTLAFGIPIMDKIIKFNQKHGQGKNPLAIILAATRELAKQVDKEFAESAAKQDTLCVYGGVPISLQMSTLDHGVDSFNVRILVHQEHEERSEITKLKLKFLVEENEDKWCSTGGYVLDYEAHVHIENHDVIKFSRKPKMRRKREGLSSTPRLNLCHHQDLGDVMEYKCGRFEINSNNQNDASIVKGNDCLHEISVLLNDGDVSELDVKCHATLVKKVCKQLVLEMTTRLCDKWLYEKEKNGDVANIALMKIVAEVPNYSVAQVISLFISPELMGKSAKVKKAKVAPKEKKRKTASHPPSLPEPPPLLGRGIGVEKERVANEGLTMNVHDIDAYWVQRKISQPFKHNTDPRNGFVQIDFNHLFPYLVNIASGFGLIKIYGVEMFQRFSRTIFGRGTYWSLGKLLIKSKSLDDLLELSQMGERDYLNVLLQHPISFYLSNMVACLNIYQKIRKFETEYSKAGLDVQLVFAGGSSKLKGQLRILAHSFAQSLCGNDFYEVTFHQFSERFKDEDKINVKGVVVSYIICTSLKLEVSGAENVTSRPLKAAKILSLNSSSIHDELTVEFKNAQVLVRDQKISTTKDIISLLEETTQLGAPLFIAEYVTGEALATLVVNEFRAIQNVDAMKVTGFGEIRKALLQDIAILTGAEYRATYMGLLGEEVKVVEWRSITYNAMIKVFENMIEAGIICIASNEFSYYDTLDTTATLGALPSRYGWNERYGWSGGEEEFQFIFAKCLPRRRPPPEPRPVYGASIIYKS